MLETFKICQSIKRFLLFSLGFPAYSPAYIRRFIDTPRTSPQELRHYLDCSFSSRTNRRNLLIVWSCLFYVKTILYPNYIFTSLNTRDMSSNLVLTSEVNSTNNHYTFLCLATNCSRLRGPDNEARQDIPQDADDLLADDFFTLPLFTLCRPRLSKLHDLSQNLGPLGLLMSSVMGIALALGGIALPLIQIFRPTGTLFMMFIVAPNVTRQVVVERIKELYLEMSCSYQNYCITLIRRKLNQTRDLLYQPGRQRFRPTIASGSHRWSHRRDSKLDESRMLWPKMANVDQIWAQKQLASDEFAWDCLTSTRSSWWLHLLASSFIQQAVFNALVFLLFLLLVHPYSLSQTNLKRVQLNLIDKQMKQSNCSIWFSDHNDGRQSIELNEIDLGWNWLYLSQIVGQLWPGLCLTTFCTCFYGSNVELLNWLSEVQLQLHLCLEFTREFRLRTRMNEMMGPIYAGYPMSTGEAITSGKLFNMQPIRRKHKTLTRVWMLLLTTKKMGTNNTTTSSEFEFKLAIQEFVSNSDLWIEKHLEPHTTEHYLNSLVEMNQKLYISYRVFVEHVDLYAPTIAIMIIMINLLNYMYLSNSVWYVRYIPGFLFEPILMVVGGWFASIFFIIMPSTLHAKVSITIFHREPYLYSLLT